MEPNPQQQAVIDFGKYDTGSLNLIACAGTGKTTTLLQLVSALDGATWFCAFNKAIVSEIEFKISKMSSIREGAVRVSTVHSGGMRAWTKHLRGLGVQCAPPESRKVRKGIQQLGENNEFYVKHEAILNSMVELAKSSGFGVLNRLNSKDAWYDLIEHFGLDSEVDSDKDWDPLISASISLYKRSLELCLDGVIDFSDMLLAPIYHGAKFPKYDNILIDEAQDISPLRLRLIMSCLKSGGRVIAVGDPNQAIYGFTGADDKSMDTIKDRCKSIELPLTITYRCPKLIVELAKEWVPRIEAHPSAPDGVHIAVALKPDPTGALQTRTLWDCAPFTKDDAILCRNTKPLVELAYAFLRKQIPCMIEGRDIGEQLIRIATRDKSITDLNDLHVSISEWADKEEEKFHRLKQDYKAEQIRDQADTIIVLIDATKDTGGKTVDDYVALIRRMFGDTPEGGKPQCTTLATVHKSKGREWPRVFILGRNRYMPSPYAKQPWEQQQEQNLMYVAVTRAMRELIDIKVPLK